MGKFINFRHNIYQIIQSKNLKHGILYTVFSFINNGTSFILLLILADYLSPNEYGQLNLFMSFITVLSFIISLASNSYVGVCFFKKEHAILQQIFSICILITTLMLILLFIFVFFCNDLVVKYLGFPIIIVYIGIIICYFQVFINLILDVWRREEKPIKYGIFSSIYSLANFVLTFIFITNLNYGWDGRPYSWLIVSFIFFIISVVALKKQGYFKLSIPSWSLWKETLLFSIPLLPHTTSFWLKSGLDRYIINYYYNSSYVGYYSLALNISAIITMIGQAFNSSNSITVYKKLSEGYLKNKESINKQKKILIILFICISISVIILGSVVIWIMLPKYSDSLVYIIPLCISALFQSLYLLWVNFLFFFNSTKQLMFITFSMAILHMGLSLLLTKYNLLYTSLISIFTSLCIFILVRYKANRILNKII